MSVPRTGGRFAVLLAVLTVAVTMGAPASPAFAERDVVADAQKWYLDLLKIKQVHQVTKGAGQIVGVMDTDVDPSLPDLKDRVVPGHAFSDLTSPEGYGNRDFHGTSMAGIIAGRGGFDRVLGIAPEAKVMPLSLGVGFGEPDIVAGMRWAADNGIKVLNMSLGSVREPSEREIAAARYAMSKDVVLVTSMGNTEDMTQVNSLARIPGVVAVTGLDRSSRFWSGSQKGPAAVLSAPGDMVVGPCPTRHCTDGRGAGSGTSASAAVVSGVAALIRAKYPDLNAAAVINRMIVTADDLGRKGRDDEYGFGRVDPLAALTEDVPAPAANPLLPSAAPQAGDAAPPAERGSFLGGPAGIALAGGAVLVVVALLTTFLVVRRRRRPTAGAALQYPMQPGAAPWQQAPPGYPPPAGPGTGQHPPGPGRPPWDQPPS